MGDECATYGNFVNAIKSDLSANELGLYVEAHVITLIKWNFSATTVWAPVWLVREEDRDKEMEKKDRKRDRKKRKERKKIWMKEKSYKERKMVTRWVRRHQKSTLIIYHIPSNRKCIWNRIQFISFSLCIKLLVEYLFIWLHNHLL